LGVVWQRDRVVAMAAITRPVVLPLASLRIALRYKMAGCKQTELV
jgi:hypothetical protein